MGASSQREKALGSGQNVPLNRMGSEVPGSLAPPPSKLNGGFPAFNAPVNGLYRDRHLAAWTVANEICHCSAT